jgi:membrane peptidoglycan carboxypeptidase
MRRRDHNVFTNAFVLLVCGLITGVVVAAAVFPYAAMSGLAAKAGEQAFASLPGELKAFRSPQVSRVYASDDKTMLAQFHDEFRSDVPLKSISKAMQDAMVAAEDRQFFEHNGVDVKGVARALVNNNQGGPKQGASTITMQWVRMSLAYSATNPQDVVEATQDTPKRKITEMKYALEVEKQLTKDQILERYLNIVPFGKRTYGVYAAARVYFNKLPKDLTIGEAAMLAGIVRAPSGYDPTTPDGHQEIKQRRDAYVIPGMVEMGAITQAQATAAIKEPIPRKVRTVSNGCVSVSTNNWGFFCDYFYRWWMGRQEFGPAPYERERRLKSGGYRITTTLDIRAQNQARDRIGELISQDNKNALLLAAIQPGSGKVRVLAANRRYKLDDTDNPQNRMSSDPRKARKGVRGTYPNTTNPLLSGGGDITGYQAGSVMKIFTIIAALENDFPLAYPIKTEKRYKSKYIINRSNPSACEGTHFWCPSNSGGGGEGIYNMWTGLGASINTYFVPLEERVGADKVVEAAKRFGVQFRAEKDAEFAAPGSSHQWGAFTLGVSATTPLDMANAYATLAADGMYCQPTPIEQIITRDDVKLDVGRPECNRATTENVARAAVDAARCPVGDSARLGSCGGRSTAGNTRGIVGHPVFGKTGTTDKDRTASLIAGTTELVVAGYLVNPDYQAHRDRLRHDQVNPAVIRTLPDYMEGKPKVQFKRPESRKIAYGEQRSIPDVECDSLRSARNRIARAGFFVSVGKEVESECPAGTAAGTNPTGRTVKGGPVIIEVSKGKKPDPTEPGTPIIILPPGPR